MPSLDDDRHSAPRHRRCFEARGVAAATVPLARGLGALSACLSGTPGPFVARRVAFVAAPGCRLSHRAAGGPG